jgi:hypothetical protein
MGCKNVEQLFMQKRLPTQDPEEGIAHRLRFVQGAVHGIEFDFGLLASHVDPAALTAKIAGVDDRQVKKGREKLPSLQSLLVSDHTPESSPASEITKLP